MKKRLIYYLLTLALLGGCATVKPKREVVWLCNSETEERGCR
jgi:hypothetical protein